MSTEAKTEATFATVVLDAMLARIVHLFLIGARGAEPIARQAAHRALMAYNPRTEAELTLAAEIVSFSLHALDALNRSADPSLSVNQLCRLRSNAVSLSREAHNARRKLEQMQKAATTQPEIQPSNYPVEPANPAPRPAGQTWTQAYHQRQRDKRLAERARKAERRNPVTPAIMESDSMGTDAALLAALAQPSNTGSFPLSSS